MRNIFLLISMFSAINYIKSQFITVGTTNVRNKATKSISSCDNSGKSGLVEHFFNILFNEFHNTPPVCVCVQMCPDQPTYCYPNGCLRRTDANRKPEAPVTRLENVNTKPVFFLEDKNDFINDFMNKNYVDENKGAFVPVPFKQTNVMPINHRPDPFKDRYKILFKYKKMPKVELKYNLGEQVKNTKSDAVNKENMDVSKTRWPRNKMHHHVNGHRIHSDSDAHPESAFHISNEKVITNYPPKYFKRELVNNTNDEEDIDLKAILVVGKTEMDNTPFSLERLIDSLIENSFDNNNTSNLNKDSISNEIHKNNNDSSNSVTEINITTVTVNATMETPLAKQNISNTATNVLSLNYTNENIEKNRYTETKLETGTQNKTHEVSDIIASLAKRIEIQNNTSLEMVRRMGDEFDFDSTTITMDKYADITTEKENIGMITTENMVASVDYDLKTTKKSRQRLAKRLINSKNN